MSRREGKDKKHEMISDMKLLYKTFMGEFRRLHVRMDELNERVNDVSRAAIENNKSNGVRPRELNIAGYEKDEVDDHSVRGRPRRDERREDRAERWGNNINAIKMKIPPFKGRYDPKDYLEWERKLELIFACHNYSKEKKVRLIAIEFSNHVSIWWDELNKNRRRNGEVPLSTWAKMKKRYVPSYYYRDVHQ